MDDNTAREVKNRERKRMNREEMTYKIMKRAKTPQYCVFGPGLPWSVGPIDWVLEMLLTHRETGVEVER